MQNDFHDNYQSAYGKGHAIKTDPLKVRSDITGALRAGNTTALIMRDLFAPLMQSIIRYY